MGGKEGVNRGIGKQGSWLSHCIRGQVVTPIYQDHLATDHAGSRATQKCHHPGHVVRCDQPSSRDFLGGTLDQDLFLFAQRQSALELLSQPAQEILR